VILGAPLGTPSARGVGVDLWSDPARRVAMEHARETGRPSMSGRVLVEGDSGVLEPGFSVYLAIDPEEVSGHFVSVPARAHWAHTDLVAGRLLKRALADRLLGRLHVEVFDGTEPAPEHLLVASEPPPAGLLLSRVEQLTWAGRPWTVRVTARAPVQAGLRLSEVVGPAGALFTLLWLGLVLSQIRARRAAEESLAARDEFVAVASHELKTPLTPLKLQLQSLVAIVELEPPGPASERLLRKARAATTQLARFEALVERLLNLSRLSLGRAQLTPQEVDVSELVRGVVDRMAETFRAARCDVALRVPEPVRGRWDKLALEQVVENLLANAVKFGAGKPIEIDVSATRRDAMIRVADHGIGIPSKQQRMIFERFERAVSETHYGGFGLGLFIASQIVEASGGSIAVESEQGHGATFTVMLPRVAPAASRPS
jgi:two-component system, OmpR family, sensor kinase